MPSCEVNEVFVVFAVSWEETVVLLKDGWTEKGTECRAWIERAMSSVGTLKCGGGMGETCET